MRPRGFREPAGGLAPKKGGAHETRDGSQLSQIFVIFDIGVTRELRL